MKIACLGDSITSGSNMDNLDNYQQYSYPSVLKNILNAKEVYNNVTRGLYKKGRNVVLMHDFAGNKKTINALEKIIEYGKKNGYRFETITTDTPAIRHDINN